MGSVFIVLYNGDAVEVTLDEFLKLEAVESFQQSLRDTMIDILETADSEWINWVRTNPSRRLAIVLTGGGASLPMARSLAEGEVEVHGSAVLVALAKDYPSWLSEDYPELEDHYSRIAVSLGGARHNTFKSIGVLKTTGSGLGGYKLESFPTRGA